MSIESSNSDAYTQLQQLTEQLTELFCNGVIDTVAKKHFEEDRGHKVTQTLPDKTENYEFESHSFNALVLPDECTVVNHAYDETPISVGMFVKEPELFGEMLSSAQSLWEDTFGEFQQHVTQPTHPGPFPLQEHTDDTIEKIQRLYDDTVSEKRLSAIVDAVSNENYALVGDMFELSESELFTPGSSDESVFPELTNPKTPYIDDEICVMVSGSATSTATPTRGVIVGHDDTPTGIFAHVVDVTNLSPTQTTTRDAIRDAMGFDSEIDPWNPPDSLALDTGERVRLQGDLRVERIGDASTFGVEIARRTRIAEYEAIIEDALDELVITSDLIRGRDTDLPIRDVVDVSVSKSGEVSLASITTDNRIEALTYVAIFSRIDGSSNRQHTSLSDVGFITHSETLGVQVGQPTREELAAMQLSAQQTLNDVTDDATTSVNETAREKAAEVEAAMEIPGQVNLPVDNHLAFIKNGHAPAVDTEPIPVGVPEETTLHIEHDEHNAITVTVPQGVYRFSLLPRGLRPANERPDWPSK